MIPPVDCNHEHIGGYDKEDKAARAYDLAALKYWGTTTTTNFPVRKFCINNIVVLFLALFFLSLLYFSAKNLNLELIRSVNLVIYICR